MHDDADAQASDPAPILNSMKTAVMKCRLIQNSKSSKAARSADQQGGQGYVCPSLDSYSINKNDTSTANHQNGYESGGMRGSTEWWWISFSWYGLLMSLGGQMTGISEVWVKQHVPSRAHSPTLECALSMSHCAKLLSRSGSVFLCVCVCLIESTRGWKSDSHSLVQNWVCSHPMVCCSYLLTFVFFVCVNVSECFHLCVCLCVSLIPQETGAVNHTQGY